MPGGAQLLLAHLGRADDPLRHDGLPRDTGAGTGVFRRLAVLRRHCNLCAASCFAETGDYDRKPDYICSLTHTLCRITREKYGTED